MAMDEWPKGRLGQIKAGIAADEAFEWQRWALEIPFIEFPPGWKVKVIPPMAGAIIRLIVKVPGYDTKVSVYLDCYNCLGSMPWPYWEVYPYHQDTGRCRMDDVDTLLMMIADRELGEEDE